MEEKVIKHWKRCNYCRNVVPASECKGFKCVKCMEKDKDKANGNK